MNIFKSLLRIFLGNCSLWNCSLHLTSNLTGLSCFTFGYSMHCHFIAASDFLFCDLQAGTGIAGLIALEISKQVIPLALMITIFIMFYNICKLRHEAIGNKT